MKRLLLVFQMGSEVRQFGHSGFIDQMLENGWEVLVTTRFPGQYFLSQLDPRVQIIPLPKAHSDFWYELLAGILDNAQSFRRHKVGRSTWSYGKSVKKNYRQKYRQLFQYHLGRILSLSTILYKTAQCLEASRIKVCGKKEYGEFLHICSPTAVVVSVPRLNYQAFLLSAAEEQGIPRILFFHTNKDIVALGRFDHHYSSIGVWNEWMKTNLLAQNPGLSADAVHITGCSHFDPLGRDDLLYQDFEFRKMIGVKEKERIILYTAAGPGVLPQEERFIEEVHKAIMTLPGFKPRLVVRINPMDDSTWLDNYLSEHHPDIIALRPDWYYDRTMNLCYQKKEDLKVWSSLLKYSDVCVNIPSTVTVECALADLPIINIGYDLPGPRPLPGSVKAFWNVDYYANVRQSGAVILCETQMDLQTALRKCLENKQILRAQQQDLIHMELGYVLPPTAHTVYCNLIEALVNE